MFLNLQLEPLAISQLLDSILRTSPLHASPAPQQHQRSSKNKPKHG